MIEKSDIEDEVERDEDKVDEVENKFLLKPLLSVIKFNQLDLILKVIVYSFK